MALWRRGIEVYDADDHLIGYSDNRTFSGRGNFWVYDRRGVPFVEVKKSPQGRRCWFVGPDSRELGFLTSEETETGSEAAAVANLCLVSISEELAEQPLAKMLLLGAALARPLVNRDQRNNKENNYAQRRWAASSGGSVSGNDSTQSPKAIICGWPIRFIFMYLANFSVDPFSLGAGFRGFLLLRNDGHATLIHDNRLPNSVESAHVDERRVVDWYDGQSPCPRTAAIGGFGAGESRWHGLALSRSHRRPVCRGPDQHGGGHAPPQGSGRDRSCSGTACGPRRPGTPGLGPTSSPA